MSQSRALKIELGEDSPVYAELFLPGREFTALVVGGEATDDIYVYPVAERVFDASLPVFERFLAFNRYWHGYSASSDTPIDGTVLMYRYDLAPVELQPLLIKIASDAYRSVGGCSYGRVDLRSNKLDPDESSIFVLEVNSQASFSFDKGTSSMADILIMSQVAPEEFLHKLLSSARGIKKEII